MKYLLSDLNKMAVSHDELLRVSSCPGQLQMSCAGDFLAFPLTKTIIGVWWLGDLSRKVCYCLVSIINIRSMVLVTVCQLFDRQLMFVLERAGL